MLEPLLLLIYDNDLPNGIESVCKIFADDTSLFLNIKDETFSDTRFNNDLNKISKCAFQWKILFTPDLSKQAIEVFLINVTMKITVYWYLMTPWYNSLF